MDRRLIRLQRKLRNWAQVAADRYESEPEAVSTGSGLLDLYLGGGFARGAVTSIYHEPKARVWPFLALAIRQSPATVVTTTPLDPFELDLLGVQKKILVFQTTDGEALKTAMDKVSEYGRPLFIIIYPENILEDRTYIASVVRSIRSFDMATLIVQRDNRRAGKAERLLSEVDHEAILVKQSPPHRIDLGLYSPGSTLFAVDLSLYLKECQLDERKDKDAKDRARLYRADTEKQ